MAKYTYAGRVKGALTDLHKTQKELAEALHFHPSYINKIISGVIPSPEHRKEIDRVLAAWREEAKNA